MADPSRTASGDDGLDGLKRVGLPASAHQRRSDRTRIDRQIAAVETALAGLRGSIGRGGSAAKKVAAKAATRTRRKMSATQKKAVSRRMKEYWEQRRKAAAK